jgi:chromatin remodeling complex protein RSC6
MVRTSKPTTASSVPSPSAASVPSAPAPSASSVPSEKKAASKKTAAKETVSSSVPPASVPSAAPSVPSADVVEAVSEGEEGAVSSEISATEKLAAFAAVLAAGNNVFAQLKTQFKVLEKSIQKELKFAQKVSSRKLKRSGNRKPSGFVCPTLISDELCAFLGQPAGTLMARTDVGREINAYIKANNLKDAANGRQINADAKLAALLKLQSGDILTFFNLQRYLKTHFIKADAAAPVETAV